MIDASSIAIAIRIALSAFTLCWLVLWLYRDYCVERFRQEMFALRDELFVAAANGLVPFDHPSYGLLRGTMNGFIRFGQRISFLQLVALRLFLKFRNVQDVSFAAKWSACLNDLPVEIKGELNGYLMRMHLVILKYLFLGSPISLVTIIVPMFFVFACRYYFTKLLDHFSELLNEIDSAAMECGVSNTAAEAVAADLVPAG